LFVDVRGSSSLGQRLGPTQFAKVITRYYEIATEAMVETEAFVEITGDEVFGLHLPAYTRGNYAQVAIRAAEKILRSVDELSVGASVEVGPEWVGTVGDAVKVRDFRAIGDTVNVGAGLVAKAGAGECLISDRAYRQAELQWANLESRTLTIKVEASRWQSTC
jgi:adenylate cyclase